MEIILKRPNDEPAELIEVENSDAAITAVLGGQFEKAKILSDAVLLYIKDGKAFGHRKNKVKLGDFYGTVAVAGYDPESGELCDVRSPEIFFGKYYVRTKGFRYEGKKT